MKSFKHFLSEAYSFFPTNLKELQLELRAAKFPEDNVEEITNLYAFLKSWDSSTNEPPINIDLKKPNHINVSRRYAGTIDIKDIKKGAKLSKLKIKFGNGSSGNRGVNNRGNLFEPKFASTLEAWWNGEDIEDRAMLGAIQDLEKTYDLSSSSMLKVNVVGGENTRRPLAINGRSIVLTNTKGSGLDVGSSVTDVTLETDQGPIYLSLKLGTTTTFFNVGIKTILTKKEIETGNITNKDGLALLELFGIDPVLFCDVFNGTLKKPIVDKGAKVNKRSLQKLLESGIGYGYHIIHKLGKKIISKQMDQRAMSKAATPGSVTIYYGGKTGSGKRVNIEFESPSYTFSINIRDTQGKDGYPTRMMCDFKSK